MNSLILITVCMTILMQIQCSDYTKVNWAKLNFSVKASRICKSQYNSLIFAGSHGTIKSWSQARQLKKYSSFSHHNKTIIQIACTSYNSDGTVVFLDQTGNISIWKEKVGIFSGYSLQERKFNVMGDKIVAVSVSEDMIGLATHNQLSLYKTSNLKLVKTFEIPQCENIILNNDNTIFVAGNNRLSMIDHNNGYVTDSVKIAENNPYFALKDDSLLVAGLNKDTTANTAQQFKTTPPFISNIGNYANFTAIGYCDGDISQTHDNVFSKMSRTDISLHQPIQSFVCVEQNKFLVYSMVYLISVDKNGKNFLDCYYAYNQLFTWIIIGVVLCCACCCQILARGGLKCLVEMFVCIGVLLKLIIENILWLPTRENMQELENKLKK